ncbi:monocarboxylate transporter 12-like [Pecten maximus]|uniref:monocarboxylate transporter 12-like n=1 Tax=Pecten maximus TaxID=6579 RepID=UPI001458870F|nr:monocarboxylate transporter 12-like [Pecten maximus]
MSSEEEAKAKNVSYRRWIVLTSGFFVIFLCHGFAFHLSVLFPELLRTFGRSKAETALVQSITAGLLFVAGTPWGKSVSRYGARITGITGSLLVTLGLVFSFFAKGIPDLIVTLGVVSGIGFSATFISASTSIGEYFEGKSKLTALAFLTFGSGCGGVIIPFMMKTLIDEYGWRGCLLITGGLMANMVCFFAVCKPVSVGISHIKANDFDENSKQNNFTASLKSLVANKVYIVHVIAMCCTIPVINSSLTFMIDFLMTKGFDSETQVILYICLNVGVAFGGVLPGLLKKYIPHTSVLFIPAFFTLVGTTVYSFLPSAETYTHHVVLLVTLGVALGVSVTTVTMTTMKLVGLHDYTVGLGILMTLLGISNSIAGPIAGLFADLTESYTQPFHGFSIGLGVASCLFVFAGILKRRTRTTHHCDNELNITPAVISNISSETRTTDFNIHHTAFI